MSQLSLTSSSGSSCQDYHLAIDGLYAREFERLESELAAAECNSSPEGTDELEVHRARLTLAAFYMHHGQKNAARPLLRQATQGLEAALGNRHPETMSAICDLASCSHPLKAEHLFLRVYENSSETLGRDHPLTLHIASSLGKLYLKSLAVPREAEVYLAHVANSTERVFGPTSPECKAALRSLGECYTAQSKAIQATEVYHFLIDCIELSEGPTSPNIFVAGNALVVMLRENGREPEADRVLEWIMQRQFGAMGRLAPPWKSKRRSGLYSARSSTSMPPSRVNSQMGLPRGRPLESTPEMNEKRVSRALTMRRTLSSASQAPVILKRTVSSGCSSITKGKGKGYLKMLRNITLRA